MTLLIIEDQEGVFAMLRDLLAAALPRVRILHADSRTVALVVCSRERPQLALLGLADAAHGIELTEQLRAYSPAPAVIVISRLSDIDYAASVRAAGACAFIPVDQLATELVPAVAWALGITGPLPGSPSSS